MDVKIVQSNRVTHGQSGSAEHTAWYDLRRRCNNPNYPQYHNYGGRGIGYDPRWEHFENFYEDMGPKPGPEYTLEREDNDGDYCKSNCSWATRKKQAHNRSTNVYFEVDGVKLCQMEAARSLGVNPVTATSRLNRGWPVPLAFGLPLDSTRIKKL